MPDFRRDMPGLGAAAIGLAVLLGAGEHAPAQYICDVRFNPACPSTPQEMAQPPQAQPGWPFSPFRRRDYPPPPQPEPAQPFAPQRPGYVAPLDPGLARQYATLYAPVRGEPFPVPAVRLNEIDPTYLRKQVYFPSNEAPGTIIVDGQNRFLYFVQGGGQAIRYGVGVGREGFGWSGVATIRSKQAWPDWYPPKEMIARQPELRRQLSQLQSGIGVPGGPRNPLGARAMYLWQGNKDTLYRIHGTFEPWTIGRNVSSGCIRMINQDVIDLYERTPLGAKVVVLSPRA
jgi:lipoprotein-anchoring transpeptidase ErfK/SrfK